MSGPLSLSKSMLSCDALCLVVKECPLSVRAYAPPNRLSTTCRDYPCICIVHRDWPTVCQDFLSVHCWSCYVASLIPVDHLLASGQFLYGIIYFSLPLSPFQSIYGVLSSLFFISCTVHLHPFSASLTFGMSPVFLNCNMCRRYSTASSGFH